MPSPGAQGREVGICGDSPSHHHLCRYPHKETGKEDGNKSSLRIATLCLSVPTALHTLTRPLSSFHVTGRETRPERKDLSQDPEPSRVGGGPSTLVVGPQALCS